MSRLSLLLQCAGYCALTAQLISTAHAVSAAGPITWLPDADGNWEDAINWSSNPALPTSVDDVSIDVGGAIVRTITINTSNPDILSLDSQENIFLDGGSFTFTGASINADFSAASGSTLNIGSGGFAATTISNIDGTSIFAEGAGLADFSPLTSYSTGNISRTWQASDPETTLDLSNLSTLEGGTSIFELNVNALSSSSINLSGLVTYNTGNIKFTANGDASAIDLSSLTTFTDDNTSDFSQFKAEAGGTINTTSLIAVDGQRSSSGLRIIVDGATSTVNTANLQTFKNARLELSNGGSISTASLTNIDGSSLYVSGGSSFTLPATITQYITDAGNSNGSRTWQADGIDGTASLDLSSLTHITGGTNIFELNVEAVNGGTIDLFNFANYLGGNIKFTADGMGSFIDLSSLTQYNDNNNSDNSLLYATNGGQINTGLTNVDGLQSGSGLHITINGSESIITTGVLTSLRNARLELSNDATFDISALTNLDGTSLFVSEGSSIVIPAAVTSYITDAGANNGSRTWQADGSEGSAEIDLSSLTDITGGTSIFELNVKATEGGIINLSNFLNYLGGNIKFTADGTGSEIDLGSLTTYSDDNNSDNSLLYATNGGEITTSLTTVNGLQSGSGLHITVDGADSRITTSGITSLKNARLELLNGGTFDITTLNNFDGTSLFASNGSSIVIPAGVTSYLTDAGANNGSRIWEADGSDGAAQINLSSITDITGGSSIFELNINAINGGSINLSNFENYLGGNIQFTASGMGSFIDLSSLTQYNDDNNSDNSLLYAVDGGNIATGLTTVDGRQSGSGLHITVDGASSSVGTSSLSTFNNGRLELTNGASTDLSMLTNIDGSSLFVSGGSSLELPAAVTSYITDAGTNNGNRIWQADGNEGSALLDLSSITDITGGTSIFELNIQALNGGIIDLSGTTQIRDGHVKITSDGTDSDIRLDSLQSFNDPLSSERSSIEASNQGTIHLSQTGTTQITDVDISLSNAGIINADTIHILGSTTARQSHLFGTGTIDGNLISDALITPGDQGGSLAINGDLTLGNSSTLHFEIGGTNPVIEYGFIAVTGDLNAGGIIDFSFFNNFEDIISSGDVFTVLAANSISGSFASVLNGERLLSSEGNYSFIVNYGEGSLFGASSLVLSDFEAVPEPETYLLFISGLSLIYFLRRRR